LFIDGLWFLSIDIFAIEGYNRSSAWGGEGIRAKAQKDDRDQKSVVRRQKLRELHREEDFGLRI